MAMTKESMAAKIILNLSATEPGILLDPVYEVRWRAICDGIISEIKQNMDITTSVPVVGVTAGPATINATGTDTSIL